MKNLNILNKIEGAGGGKGGGDQRIPQEAPNTLRATQTVSTVEVLSEGPVKGLLGDPDILQGILFDKTPVESSNGDFNFSGVSAQFREGLPSQEPMSGFSGTEDIFSVNVELLNDNSVIRTIDSNADAARIIITLPNGLSRRNEENGDLEGYRVEFTVDTRPFGGTWTQALTHEISGKSVTSYSEAHRIERPSTTGFWEIRVRRRTEFQDKSTIVENMFVSSIVEITDLDISYDDAAVVGVAVDAESTGGTIPTRSFLLDGLKIQVPDVYQPTVYNSDGSVQSFASFSGTWDGFSFKEEWADDPAWICYNMLINDRWGLGINPNDVDQFSFFEASQYNMELIQKSVNDTTLEPRFTFNGVIATRQDPYQTIQSVASNARGAIFAASGRIKFIQDRPTEPITIINQSNVVDGLFTYSSTENNDRFTSVNVTYNDIENRYNPRTINERADADAFDRYGFNHQELEALGVVRESQARRLAKWTLDSTLNNRDIVEFSVGWSESLVDVGEVFYLADNDFANIQFSGTVLDVLGAVGSQTIKVDRDITDLVTPANILLLSPTGQETEVSIDSINQDEIVTSTLTDLSEFSKAEYVITNTDISPRQFKVTGISERQGDGILDITAVEFDPAKFDRVEQGIEVDGPPVVFDGAEIDKPTGLQADIESVITPNDTIRFRVRLSWNDSNDELFSHYLVRWRRNADQFTDSNELSQPQFIIDDALPGFYEVMINAVNTRGVQSPPALRSFIVSLDGQSSPIGPVDNLQLVGGGTNFSGTAFTVEWTEPTFLGDAQIKDYVVQLVDVSDPQNIVPFKIFVSEDLRQKITRADVIDAFDTSIRNINVEVRARDTLNRLSDDPVIQTFTNPAPDALTITSVESQIGSYKLIHPEPLEADADGIKIWHETTTGFTPAPSNLVKDDVGTQHIVEGDQGQQYFIKIAAYDTWSRNANELNFSLEDSVTIDFDPTQPATPEDPLTPVAGSNIKTLTNGTQVADIEITWGKVPDANAYDIEIFRDGVLFSIPVVSQPDSGSTVTFQLNADIGIQYCFRIRSRNGRAISDWSTQECITQTADATSPSVPTGISTSPRYQGALVQWNNPSNANFAATEVWRRVGSSGTGTKVADVPRPSAFMFDDGLTIGTTYQYRVRSVSVEGEASNFSTWSSVVPSNVPPRSISAGEIVADTITGDLIQGQTLTGDLLDVNEIITLTSQLGDATISTAKLEGVLRSDNFQSGVQGWEIKRSGEVEFGELFARGDIVTGLSPDFRTEITRPQSASDYVIWSGTGSKTNANAVFFVRADGTSVFSGTFDGTIPSDNITLPSRPSRPSGLSVSSGVVTLPGPSQVANFDLSWNNVSGIDRYEVRVREGFTTISVISVGDNLFNWRGDIGTTYRFRVRSVDSFGQTSNWSSEVSRTVSGDSSAPGSPFGLSTTAILEGVALSWTNTSSSNLSHVEVWRSRNFSSFQKVAELPKPTNSYFDNGLDIVNYRYRLRSVSLNGVVSSFTGTSSKTPLETDFDIPANSITETEIANNSISTPLLQANAVTANEISTRTITSNEIATRSIVASRIVSGSLTANEISAGTITATELSSSELITNSAQIADALITSAKIAQQIESDNYVPGSTGWAINRGGTAEFTNVVARGNLISGSSPNQRTEITSSGVYRIWIGSGTKNDDGIFWVKSDGSAKINKQEFGIPEGGGGISVIVNGSVSSSGSGFSQCGTPGSTNTGDVGTTVQNAEGSVSYSWSHISTSSGSTPSIFGSTNATPRWNAGTVCDAEPSTSQWKVVVTDSAGNKASDIIGVNIFWTNLS